MATRGVISDYFRDYSYVLKLSSEPDGLSVKTLSFLSLKRGEVQSVFSPASLER